MIVIEIWVLCQHETDYDMERTIKIIEIFLNKDSNLDSNLLLKWDLHIIY